MNLIIAGHSCSHYRQRVLGEATAKLGVRTVVAGPERWGDESYEPYKKKDFVFKTLPIAGAPSFYSFSFKKLNRVIFGYRPCVIYSMEEPFTLFTRECIRYAREYKCPFNFFTWENKLDYRLSEPFDRIEQDAIEVADKIICGNKLARERMLRCGADKGKLRVLLQSGVDTDLFHPVEHVEKAYDVIYHGRLVREKGLPFLENICRELEARLITVGGRGQYHFRYGDSITWMDYETLPEIINRARIGVQIPFSFRGYQEQGNFAIAENMACCNPVIASDNGSIPDNYRGSPVVMIPENNEGRLKEEISKLMDDEDRRVKLGVESRKWVVKNLGLEAMGRKLLKILELM